LDRRGAVAALPRRAARGTTYRKVTCGAPPSPASVCQAVQGCRPAHQTLRRYSLFEHLKKIGFRWCRGRYWAASGLRPKEN